MYTTLSLIVIIFFGLFVGSWISAWTIVSSGQLVWNKQELVEQVAMNVLVMGASFCGATMTLGGMIWLLNT